MRVVTSVNKISKVLGRLIAFSLLIACFFILTNEALPSLRHADGSIVIFRSLGLMAVFSVPAFLPLQTARLLAKAYVRRILLAVLLLGAVVCFALILLIPQSLYSRVLAFLIGLLLAIVVCFWITAFRNFRTNELLLFMPYIFLFAVVLTLALLLLPQPYHEYAVLAATLLSVVLGAIFQRRAVVSAVATVSVRTPAAAQRQTVVQVLLISAGIGISSEVIRLLAFNNIYETPDALYMTFCVVTFLALLSALCFALFKLNNTGARIHIAVLFAAVIVLSVLVSLFTWLGHQGLFVFMGNIAICLGSLLLPLLYARRKSIAPVQAVGIVQFGLASGILLGYLSKTFILLVDLSLEIQIIALFLNVVLLGVALLTTIFGVRQTAAQPAQRASTQTSAPPQKDFGKHLATLGLTARQAEIAVLVAKGYSVPSIAEELVISRKTVENHLMRVYKVLDIRNKQDLIKYYQSLS
jgi:DNA-binding CsgD family transcriptional regulator